MAVTKLQLVLVVSLACICVKAASLPPATVQQPQPGAGLASVTDHQPAAGVRVKRYENNEPAYDYEPYSRPSRRPRPRGSPAAVRNEDKYEYEPNYARYFRRQG